jgi:hypothetical protein
MVGSSQEEGTITSITIIAIVAALALLGIVVVTVAFTIPLQQAEARGCPISTPAVNASHARCFRG